MRSRRRSSWCSTFLFHFSSHLSAAPSKAGVCSCTVSSSCSCVRLSPFRQQGVVRPDTSVQFQKHVMAQYTVGRLFSGTLPLRFYPFSYGVVRQRRMTFQSVPDPYLPFLANLLCQTTNLPLPVAL